MFLGTILSLVRESNLFVALCMDSFRNVFGAFLGRRIQLMMNLVVIFLIHFDLGSGFWRHSLRFCEIDSFL